MGMYDNIICRYPLPGEPPSFCAKEGHSFQSKSLDCLMGVYEITQAGGLLQTGNMYGDLEKPEPVAFHGILEFYDSNWAALAYGVSFTANGEDFESVTYEATFVNGKVQSIAETEREREPALARSVYEGMDALFEKDEPEVTTTEPEVGQPMYLQWGGPSKGYPVTLLAKTQLEWIVADARGRTDKLHPTDLGRLLFHSQEESDRMKAWGEKAREQKIAYAKRLLEGKSAA
jgi:hypothetical protein